MALRDLLTNTSYVHLTFALLALTVVHLLYTAIYRLYFHPLAKFPGPFWARLTTWPSFLQTTRFNRHVWLYELQEQYGPVFRYQPDAVLFNTPEGYQEIYGAKGNVKKAEAFYRVWPHNVNINNTWNVTDIKSHARKRRVLNNAFSDRALRGAEPLVHANVDRWIDLLKAEIPRSGGEWSASLNMAQQVNYLVYDILGDLCFGQSFGMKEPGNDLRRMPEIMTSLPGFMYPIATSPWAAWWVWMKPRGLDWLLTFAIPSDLKKWQAFIAKNLATRTEKEREMKKASDAGAATGGKAARKDFFYYLFDAEDPETGKPGYDINELWGECELLTAAGADTTSIVTAAMTFYVSRNADVQSKLASEVGKTFSSYAEIVAGPKLHSCQYLRAVIHETLRMAPPVPAELVRETLPGGTSVEGHYFPEGIVLGTCTWCLSYNKDVYPSPFEFRPERWIDGTGNASVTLAESGECAFSTGSRGCVGKNMAWMEMMLVLAKLVYTFEFRQDPENDLGGGRPEAEPGYRNRDQYRIRDGWVAQRDGPMVQFKERLKV